MAEKKVNFEENIKALEETVKALEGGNISLEEMLNLFEDGVKRTKECTAQLKTAEQKITMLINQAGVMEEVPFCEE